MPGFLVECRGKGGGGEVDLCDAQSSASAALAEADGFHQHEQALLALARNLHHHGGAEAPAADGFHIPPRKPGRGEQRYMHILIVPAMLISPDCEPIVIGPSTNV